METLLRQPTIFGHGLRKGRKKEGGRRRKRRRERKDGACIGGSVLSPLCGKPVYLWLLLLFT